MASTHNLTPICSLHELCSKQGITEEYKLVAVEGPKHSPRFTYSVEVNGMLATGKGQSKKEGKHAAAKAVLKKMGVPIKGQDCGHGDDNRLSLDFLKLLMEGPDHDVELKCNKGHSIKAHKVILSARSPVLRMMLQLQFGMTVEGQTGLLQVGDMEADDVLQEFVEYLYTGKLETSMDNVHSLYGAGEKYMVEGLIKDCGDFLVENLTLENAFEILIFADAHRDQRLKEGAISYILAEGVLLLDERWQPFARSHQKLAYDVLYHFYKSHSSGCFP